MPFSIDFQVRGSQSSKSKHSSNKETFSLGSSVQVSSVKLNQDKLVPRPRKDKPHFKSVKSVKPVDINKILPEQAKKLSLAPSSKIMLPKHSDVKLIKSHGSKKIDITEPPSVSITAIKRDSINSGKTDSRKGPKTAVSSNVGDADDVICID